MLTPRQARYAFLPLMLIGLTALTGIAAIAIRQGLAAGSGEFWMLAWVLAFVLALPGAMVVLPVVSALLRHATRLETVPVAGEKIPAAGQWSRQP
ncbi:MAG: DUF2798 domain-containing protein [Cupriavidus sp.]|nr:DUF2798 domain-containing protein [Cupriavidus sp.]